ncbi:SurA N-terminal domain-containing protein [Patescibacteria group bacterium]|nr:SurA N-terminal domain-containing protein [Patescibacteria group bacterium]
MEENFEANEGKMKQWIQDNLRIIISILIVVAIAAGIYSYSKRTESPLVKDSDQTIETVGDEEIPAILENGENIELEATEKTAVSSQETEQAFIEVAAKGEGRTHLARRALANYLEKNPDSSLSPEHKIYIEDYLRKNAGGPSSLNPGSSVEFSKSLIQDAISKSKNLNQNQLKNLHKYAVRVPSLT